ncbi:MAG: hypothetical protein HFACDABA_01330 [Anaerolineales bacterium]|nr:hypothetical protein [Anaerolineales bacterium]
MPTVIRKFNPPVSVGERRRDILHAVTWQVRAATWSPPTDVYETERDYVTRVEVAGMREADFEITFEDGLLLIAGARPDIQERRAYHQMEIRFGQFSVAVPAPGPVKIESAHAEYLDGFLTVTLPKARPTFIVSEG